jgi:hypothetical protein
MWVVKDKWGNEIMLTNERWRHIIEGHWELANRLEQVLETIRLGKRKQDALDPNKYKYSKAWDDLPHNYTHIIVVIRLAPAKFVITAYPKRVR